MYIHIFIHIYIYTYVIYTTLSLDPTDSSAEPSLWAAVYPGNGGRHGSLGPASAASTVKPWGSEKPWGYDHDS